MKQRSTIDAHERMFSERRTRKPIGRGSITHPHPAAELVHAAADTRDTIVTR